MVDVRVSQPVLSFAECHLSSLLLSLAVYPGSRLNCPEDTGPQNPASLLSYEIL